MFTPHDDSARRSSMARFVARCEGVVGRSLADYAALQRFATEEARMFWRLLLEHCEIVHGGDASVVLAGDDVQTARFFPDVTLNYAENLLRAMSPEVEASAAVVYRGEDGARLELTRAEVRARVRQAAAALEAKGLHAGDRVVAVARNHPDALVAALAVTSLGATWSSVSPDMGLESVVDRFGPLEPAMLLAHAEYTFQGRTTSLEPLVAALARALPSLRVVAQLDALTPEGAAGADVDGPSARFPFDHPLFILFSSGSTGAPKCLVHGHGGTLLEHAKELLLHTDLTPGDALLFHTTTAWMMWNWALSALHTGARLVLYDGSVSHPEADALMRVVAEEGVTVFGTSPAYLQYLQASGRAPSHERDLSRLRAVLSTGSVLYPAQYDWARDNLGAVPVQSISGGTDILGCFALGNPLLPVYRGEAQCVSLGLDVRAHDGVEARRVGSGELVCVSPFPSRPVGLHGDAGGARLHDTYFSQHEGTWTHGDLVELTERGTVIVRGRSDGVMNLRGIRIGPAEIYSALHEVPEVVGALATDQEWPDEPGGRRLVLLIVLAADVALDRPLTFRIKKLLKERCSAAHVPAVIVPVPELPVTHNGKVSERAAQDLLNGREVRNLTALRNPSSLDALRREPSLWR
jgi:acetoacetyl-CoA synthetase